LSAEAAYAAHVARHEREERVYFLAQNHLPIMAAGVFEVERDSLITGVMRETVAGLLERAADAAAELHAYGPAFGDGVRDNCTSQKHLDIWRQSRTWQTQIEALQKAWAVSWSAGVPSDYRPTHGHPAGWFCWQAPDLEPDLAIRLGRRAEILERATSPAGPYCLLAPCELDALLARVEEQLPRDAKGKILGLGAASTVRRDVCGFISR
jgi:hypothetical protein